MKSSGKTCAAALLATGCAALIAVGSSFRPSLAQAAGDSPTPAEARAPDVQIIAMPLPTGEWMATAVYSRRVARADVLSRQKAFEAASGWKVHDIHIEDRSLGLKRNDGAPLSSVNDPDAPSNRVLTSVEFQTSNNVVDISDGTADISPWISAYRDQNRLNITYLMPSGIRFAYRGLRYFAGSGFTATLLPSQPGALNYGVSITDHRAGTVALPHYQAATDTQEEQAHAAARATFLSRRRAKMLWLSMIACGALVAGGLVYRWGVTRLSA